MVVATRSFQVNGLGLSSEEALANTESFAKRFHFLEESHKVAQTLRELIATHRLKGRRIHDANIVATMLSAGISHCITADTTDYRCFKQVNAISPASFGSGAL
jgi:predicted nucleic acid-binding protein